LTGVDVRLRQGATLAGRVKDDKGKPVENALVRWTALGTDTNDWSIRWRLRAATPTVTDSKGEFRMTNVETGKLVVEAYDARHLPWMKRDVVAEDGKTVELEATLQLGLVIDGRVVDVDGKPRSGATVDWSRKFGDGQQRDPYQESNGRATSDAAGAFRIEGLPAGQYELTASAPGVAPSEPQTLDAGGAAVTLQLTQAFSITGFVRTKSGAPLADVEVALSKRVSGAGAVVAKPGSGTQESSRTVKRATTGPEGEFELKDVPGGTYELRAAAPSFRPGAKANILPTVVKDVPAGRQGLVVEVDAGLTISGAVYGEDGKLVVEGWVWANPADPKAGGEASGSQIEAGRFELVGLLPVKYRINVDGPGGQRKTVVAEAGTKDLRIEFGGGGSLRVRVTVDGAATAGVRVSASNDAGSGQGVTDADGACEIKSLSEGSYSVQAFHRVGETALRGVQEGVSVRAGGPTDVELRLEKVVPK
jgi:protocatechuate 3,4-dioxygenase beta subunit